jgi:hypothetical protein
MFGMMVLMLCSEAVPIGLFVGLSLYAWRRTSGPGTETIVALTPNLEAILDGSYSMLIFLEMMIRE